MTISDAVVVDRLAQVPLFSLCSRRELQRVARRLRQTGTTLFSNCAARSWPRPGPRREHPSRSPVAAAEEYGLASL